MDLAPFDCGQFPDKVRTTPRTFLSSLPYKTQSLFPRQDRGTPLLAVVIALLVALFASLYELLPLYAAYRLLRNDTHTPSAQWKLGLLLSIFCILGFFLRGIVFLCMVALVLGYLLPQIRRLFTHRSARSLWAGLLLPLALFPALWFLAAGGFGRLSEYLVQYPYLFLSSGSAALYPRNIPWMIGLGGLGLVALPFVALKHHTLPQKFALMGLLAVLFKYAFTREAPAHLQPLLVTLLALGAYFGLGTHRPAFGFSVLIALFFGLHSLYSFGPWMPKNMAVNPIYWRPSKAPLLDPKVADIHDLPDDWRAEIEDAVCDSYPYDFLYQAAYGLTPQWRWVPQSYVDAHPALDRHTARLFAEEGASFLLWHSAGNQAHNLQRFVSLNGQYLPNVEPEVFRALLLHYAPIESEPKVLLLERQASSVPVVSERRVESRRIRLNEEIPVGTSIHSVKFTLNLSFWGRLRSLLYKEPSLFVVYRLDDDTRIRFRLNRHQTPQGVWVNPYFDHPTQFGRKVVSLQFETAHAKSYSEFVLIDLIEQNWPHPLTLRWPFLTSTVSP